MPSSGALRRMTLVRTNVSEERIASIIRLTRIGELGTKLAISSNRWRLLHEECRLLVCYAVRLL
jgi:hypothetical protein